MKGVYSQQGKGPEGREVSSHGDDDQIPEGPQDLGKTQLGCLLSTSSLSRICVLLFTYVDCIICYSEPMCELLSSELSFPVYIKRAL